MNVGEASEVNVLLRWLLDIPQTRRGDAVTDEQARAAAVRLAIGARRTLMAGVDADDVAAGWARLATLQQRCAEYAVADDPDADPPAWRCALPAWHLGDHQVRPPADSDFGGGLLTWERTP